MNISQLEFRKNLKIICDNLKIVNFFILSSTGLGLPRIVEIISYELFLKEYDHRSEKDDDMFEAIILMRKYGLELKEFGYVNFNK